MCKQRAYHYGCNHYITKTLSNCRLTFTSASKTPLCQASPTLVVSVADDCQDCQYREFCESWESRIGEAKEKCGFGKKNSTGNEYGWATWNEGQDWADEYEETPVETSEQSQAQVEVEALQSQFDELQWEHWKNFGAGRYDLQASRKRSRRPSRRCNGQSPLKNDIKIHELPAVAAVQRPEYMHRRGISGDSTNSGSESDSDISGSLELVEGGWPTQGQKMTLDDGQMDETEMMLPQY